ncbi:MAG TPA: O-antigen ligase family protein, partial [Desulfatiglandales bacterium]|nr:O-antigen ligase family protein [Desulfatiglandales bacterium]
PILCLIVLCLMSAAFSQHRQSSLWALVLLFNYLTILYLTIHLTTTRSQLKGLIWLIIGIAAFLSVFGLFKKFGMNPFSWWDYGDLKYRPDFLSATFGNCNHLAGYLEMSIPLLLGLFLLEYRGGKIFLIIYLTILLFSALILSLSRGGWIGMLTGLSFMSVCLLVSVYFKRKILLVSAIIGTIFAALVILASTPVVEEIRTLTEMDQTPNLSQRMVVWGGVMDMIGDYPVLGSGPGTFATVFTQYQPPGIASYYNYAHNDYLHFISETGLALIALIIWMGIALYRKGFEKLKNPSRLVRGTTLGAMTGITAILIHSIVDFNLHIPANAILFTILVAVVVSPIPQDNTL